MLDDADCLQPTLAAWEKVRLSERHAILDQQGLQIADNREEASSGRGALKDVIRAFKSTPRKRSAPAHGVAPSPGLVGELAHGARLAAGRVARAVAPRCAQAAHPRRSEEAASIPATPRPGAPAPRGARARRAPAQRSNAEHSITTRDLPPSVNHTEM